MADAIGFRYVYDPETKQYAHASGFVVLTPEGKVARYFFGVTFDPKEIQAALTAAGSTAQAFRAGLAAQARAILGGDLAASVEARRFTGAERAAY